MTVVTAAANELSAVALAAAIAAGDMTSEEVVTACLARIDEREARVRAWAHVHADQALAAARARDREPTRGPLHGVPIGVKDLIDTADMPTAYGSPIYAARRPDRDAVCVQRLRDAGAVILGKTVTTEFALFHPGPTRNPRDLDRTPGGSSSGSAAAVADHMVPVALGTQTAGSIVRPASFCGIYGFKPTFGTIPTDGVKAIGPSLDTLGPLARDVDDLALVTAVMAGRQPPIGSPATDLPATSPLDTGLSVAFAPTHEWRSVEPSTQALVSGLAASLGLPTTTMPASFADLVAAQMAIMDAEVAAALAHEYREHRDLLSDELVAVIERGRSVDTADVEAARQHVARCRGDLVDALAGHDALLVPSVLDEAPVGIGATGDPLLCRTWTALGAPAVAIPGLIGSSGLPIGVQVVAAPGADAAALAAARWVGAHLAPQTPRAGGRSST